VRVAMDISVGMVDRVETRFTRATAWTRIERRTWGGGLRYIIFLRGNRAEQLESKLFGEASGY
jgi:hypothetical protein